VIEKEITEDFIIGRN